MALWLHNQAVTQLEEGLRPNTRAAYIAAFQQFLAFVIVMKLGSPFCVTSIYAVWHIGIALSPHFVVSASVVVTLSIPASISKMVAILISNLACGCNWSTGCALLLGDLKLPVVT